MDAGTLVSEAVRVIKTFNPAVSTMDSHVLDSLGVFNDVRAWGGPFPMSVALACRESAVVTCARRV